MILWLLLLSCLVSWLTTGLLLRYAIARNLLDIPNSRSSHTGAVPRGGGLAIVLTFLAGMWLLVMTGLLELQTLSVYVGAGVLVALVGFVDDHRHIAARWRLLAHFIGGAWALFNLGGFPPLSVGAQVLDFGWLGDCLALLYLVWLLNLYNFMDGINGIASVQAITVCLGGVVLHIVTSSDQTGWILPALLLMSVVGFLFWNFPTAKIFMGDAGSGFIGIIIGILSIQAAWIESPLFWGWVILMGAFIVDATVTLIRRLLRREKIFEAHRSHAYQYASRIQKKHTLVTVIFEIINLVWLLPIALCVTLGMLDGILGVAIAYIPLCILAVYWKAGASELQVLPVSGRKRY